MDVGLRQGSTLSPLLFIAVVEVISRKASTRDILHKLLYADDLAVVADSEADLQEQLVDWKEIVGKHGLRVSDRDGNSQESTSWDECVEESGRGDGR